MVEASALGYDAIREEFETTRQFYRGVLRLVNVRLEKLPVAARKQVQSVSFVFPERARADSGVSSLSVGRTLADETIPINLSGAGDDHTGAFTIGPGGSLCGTGFDGKSPTDLMAAMLPTLPDLETVPASATIKLQ